MLLSHAALLVVAHDLKLVHVVGLLGKERLHLVLEHPPAGLPDVLVHGRAHRADHPAVAVALLGGGSHGPSRGPSRLGRSSRVRPRTPR